MLDAPRRRPSRISRPNAIAGTFSPSSAGPNNWSRHRSGARRPSIGAQRTAEQATDRDRLARGRVEPTGEPHALGRSLPQTKRWVHNGRMTERTESYGAGMAELMTPELARNPQPIFKALQESAPVLRVDGVGVVVTSRELASTRCSETLRCSRRARGSRPQDQTAADPAADRSARPPQVPQAPRPACSPRSACGCSRIDVTTLVNDLIDRFDGADEIDFVTQFSTPFPSQVFLTLFGLPMDDLPVFLGMKDGVIRPDQVVGHDFGHPETEAHQQQTADSIYAYFEQVLEERAGERRDDLISHFMHAEVDGERLSHEEILDICFLFLIAGLDTVTASLDCIFGYLAEHPDDGAKIIDDPDAVSSMVEEMLRWETPVMGGARVATARRR